MKSSEKGQGGHHRKKTNCQAGSRGGGGVGAGIAFSTGQEPVFSGASLGLSTWGACLKYQFRNLG